MRRATASSPCKWKRKLRRDWRVKSPLSPSSPPDRSDTTADNNNNKDSDEQRCRIIHETRAQTQKSSVFLTRSAASVPSKLSRSWVTTPNLLPPRRHFPLNGVHLVWGRKAPHQGFDYQRTYSQTCLESLQFVTNSALLENKTTLCDTWARTKRLSLHGGLVGDAPHIHNEEKHKLCLKLLLTQSGFWRKSENKALPQKRHFIETGCCHKIAPVVLKSPILQRSFERHILKTYCSQCDRSQKTCKRSHSNPSFLPKQSECFSITLNWWNFHQNVWLKTILQRRRVKLWNWTGSHRTVWRISG